MSDGAIGPAEVEAVVARVVSARVRARGAYHVAESAGLVKLDAMENPYGWPADLVDAWLERLRAVPLNRYPDPRAPGLRARLRAVMGVPAGMDLMLGNGSDELIQVVLLACGGEGSVVLAPEPSFAMYRVCSEALGREFVAVPLDEPDFSLDAARAVDAIARHRPAVVFLAYPNNPTGALPEASAVEAIIRAAPGAVVVDEAYEPFAGNTFMPALAAHPNLLVMRTVSKLGLAGLRLGVLAGHPAWLHELDKVRLPYNVNVLTEASGEFALEHYEVLRAQTARIVADREVLRRELEGFNRLTVWPSHANFLLVRAPAGEGPGVVRGLRERGVLVKDLDGAGPGLDDCLRVSVGTPEENRAFLEALRAVI